MLEIISNIFDADIAKLAVFWSFVNIVTLVPVGAMIVMLGRSFRTQGFTKRVFVFFLVTVFCWFSPSLLTIIYAVYLGASVGFYILTVVLVMLAGYTGWKKVPMTVRESVFCRFKEVFAVLLAQIAQLFLKVEIVTYENAEQMESISRFRALHVTWNGDSNGGLSSELDVFDSLPTTTHVVVKVPLFGYQILGYGRLLFKNTQLKTKYSQILAERVPNVDSVEVSRLVVAPQMRGMRVRGTLLSAVVQLLIYRVFFAVCSENGVKEWWAVLGDKLHGRLLSFGFPFKRINDITGEDEAGEYFAVVMDDAKGKMSVKARTPFLYSWFERGMSTSSKNAQIAFSQEEATT